MFQQIILRQQVTSHFGIAELLRNHAVFFVRRKIDPQVLFRNGQRGEKILNQGRILGLAIITGQRFFAAVHDKIEFEGIFGIDRHSLEDGRLRRRRDADPDTRLRQDIKNVGPGGYGDSADQQGSTDNKAQEFPDRNKILTHHTASWHRLEHFRPAGHSSVRD